MAPSYPSPSESPSDWGNSPGECGASSSSPSAASMTTGNAALDLYPTAGLPVKTESRNQRQQATPVALLPSSGTAKPLPTRQGGNRQLPVTPDGQLKSHAPANSPHRKRYATEDDWRSHKDRICALYQANKLTDVVAVMETQHHFFATQRMYKARFKEWDIKKNVTAASVHQLYQKVSAVGERSPSTPGGREVNERVVVDVGEGLDVKRIQKYMKRRPIGLEKLRTVPKGSLEVIKALSVDGGKGGSGRVKVSIPVAKLKQHQQQSTPELSPSTIAMEWPSGPHLPSNVVGLLQAFIDNHFDSSYPFTTVPHSTYARTAPSKWQSQGQNASNPAGSFTPSFVQASRHDETMLDLALKFRIALTLLADGLASEGMQTFNACLGSLAFCVQQAQGASPFDTRPATELILWALSVASEMMGDFKHSKELVRQMLLQVTALCAAYQPTMAELTKQLSQIESSSGLVTMLKLVRCSISQALFVAAECEPALETYSKTVSIAESPLSAGDKLQALQKIAADPMVLKSPALDAWVETRLAFAALSVPQASSPFVDPLGSYGTASSPSWHGQGHNRMGQILGLMAARVEVHRAAGNWQTVQQLESRYGSIVQTVWGGYHESGSQGPLASSLGPVQASGFQMAVPQVGLQMGHMMSGMPGEMAGWAELQPQQQHQGQIPGQGESPSTSAWDPSDASQWQMDPDFGSDSGGYDGSY